MDEQQTERAEDRPDNEQASEEERPGRVLTTSSTCHNLTCYSEPAEQPNAQSGDESNKENGRLFKNKSEGDLLNKSRLSKIYLPAEDTMDLEQSFKEQTAKKYSSSWFYGDASKNVYPTIEEQVKLCRKIASQLVDDENRKSKGASMFFKRVKRAAKWVVDGSHEASQTAVQCNGSSSSSSLTADEEVEKLKRNLKLDMMPNLKLILDPRELLSLEKLKKTGDIVEHNVVSPDVCHSLIKELEDSPNSPEINKGAAIFLKRKEKSRDWVVDENSAVVQAREQKREQELRKQAADNVQKEWLMKRQKESEEPSLLAAADFDFGQPKGATLYIQAKQPLKPLTPSNKADNRSNVLAQATNQSVKHNVQSNQFLKLNFKNFNRNARGWGVAPDEYEKQIEKLQQTPEYLPSIVLPSSQATSQPSFDHSLSAQFGAPFDSLPSVPFSGPSVSRQPAPSLSTSAPAYRPASNYPSHQASPVRAARVEQRNRQPAVSQRPNVAQVPSHAPIPPVHRPTAGQRGKLDPQQIAYSNSTALLNAAQHQANLANFNSYLFNKEQPNKRFAVRNDVGQQPIYSAAQYLNGPSNGSATSNDYPTDSRPTYNDLTKMEIPSRLPKFKDFNARPKMFIRGCS